MTLFFLSNCSDVVFCTICAHARGTGCSYFCIAEKTFSPGTMIGFLRGVGQGHAEYVRFSDVTLRFGVFTKKDWGRTWGNKGIYGGGRARAAAGILTCSLRKIFHWWVDHLVAGAAEIVL